MLLYVLHFKAYAEQFVLHGLHELELEHEFVLGQPAVIPQSQELDEVKHELDELDGHEVVV